jgi:hypothetical protein
MIARRLAAAERWLPRRTRVVILLGYGASRYFEGIDLPALGYRVKEHVSTEAATHLVERR